MSRTRLRESRHSRRYGVTTFLIPFTDPDSGERLVRCLLDEAQADSPEVELLAVVASPEPNLGRLSLSPQRVQELGRDIGNSWLMRLTPLLRARGIPYITRISVGRPDVEVEAALHRAGIDRILLSETAPRLPAAVDSVTLVP